MPTAPTRLRDLAEKGGYDVLKFDPRKIEVEEGFNPRNFDTIEMRQRLDELKTSIAADGVRQPLSVRFDAGRAVLVDGETRLRACLELIEEGVELLTVPVISVKGTNEAERLVIAMTANTGNPLTQLESGNGFKRLVALGWEPAKIAKHIGVTLSFVNLALELQDTPQEVKKMVAAKAVTPSRAVAETKKHGSGATAVLQQAVQKQQAAGKSGPVARDKKVPDDPYRAIVDELAAHLREEGVVSSEGNGFSTWRMRSTLSSKFFKLAKGE